jgi:hypothetical protein
MRTLLACLCLLVLATSASADSLGRGEAMGAAPTMPASYRPAFSARRFASRAATAFMAWADRSAAETPSQRSLPPILPPWRPSSELCERRRGHPGKLERGIWARSAPDVGMQGLSFHLRVSTKEACALTTPGGGGIRVIE